jgi:hypothetical protein
MVITSKYNGKCTACAGRVLKGMQVNWVRGVKGVTHADCENPQEGMAAEPERFEFKGARADGEVPANRVTLAFDFPTMTVDQLKALETLVEAELLKRSTADVKQAA